MSKGRRNTTGSKKTKKYAAISKNILSREYDRAIKTVDTLQTTCRILSSRLYKHMPHDKIFKDGTFSKESLKITRKLAKSSWEKLDKMHGEESVKKPD